MKLRSSHCSAVAVAVALAARGASDRSPPDTMTSSSTTGGGQGGGGDMNIAAICDAYCDCVGCSAITRSGCAGTWANEQKAAVAKGCVTAYDALVDCLLTTATCSGGVTSD